jgi:hypothetical protein
MVEALADKRRILGQTERRAQASENGNASVRTSTMANKERIAGRGTIVCGASRARNARCQGERI